MLNSLVFRYSDGFYVNIKDWKKDDKYLFIPKIMYCCDTFTFSQVGLNNSPEREFVMKIIFDTKKASKQRNVRESVDLDKNVCCFINDGYIPYAKEFYLQIRDGAGDPVTSYPVAVFNVNQSFIGTAANKAALIILWNTDPDNADVGSIEDIGEDFIFKFIPL